MQATTTFDGKYLTYWQGQCTDKLELNEDKTELKFINSTDTGGMWNTVGNGNIMESAFFWEVYVRKEP